jgi:hypothetical protein
MTVEWRKTSRSPMQLFLPCVGNRAPCRIWRFLMTLLVLRFITRSSFPESFVECSRLKRTFSCSTVGADIFHWYKNFYTEAIISAIRDDLLLDRSNMMGTRSHMWDHNDMAQKWMTPCRVLGGTCEPPQYGSMIDANQWVHLVGSEWYVGNTKESQAGFWNKQGEAYVCQVLEEW